MELFRSEEMQLMQVRIVVWGAFTLGVASELKDALVALILLLTRFPLGFLLAADDPCRSSS